MNDINSKLSIILSDSQFYEENKNLQDHNEIISAIQARVPDATAAEIDEYLTLISQVGHEMGEELSETDLENVAGGFAITITVAGVITAVKCAAAAGTLIGAAIWYWQNRKR